MNILLWVLQILTALLFGASGIMKLFMFDEISADVPSFGALPRGAWMAMGILKTPRPRPLAGRSAAPCGDWRLRGA